jgi:AAHS family benzoate transporter-like MFS transporter
VARRLAIGRPTGELFREARAAAENRRTTAIVAAIVILLIYQGYSLSVMGAASPWIAKSFSLDQAHLAELFAWMSVSALGSMVLARLADGFGRRHIILICLSLAPLFSLVAALAPNPPLFALFEILVSALLGGSVSSAIVLLAEELPIEQRARGQAFAALASAVGGCPELCRYSIPASMGPFVALVARAERRRGRPGGSTRPHGAG